MEVVGYVALIVFALYFSCILWLFHLILKDIAKQAFARSWGQLTIFASLTTLSFAHTWYCESWITVSCLATAEIKLDMLKFMQVRDASQKSLGSSDPKSVEFRGLRAVHPPKHERFYYRTNGAVAG